MAGIYFRRCQSGVFVYRLGRGLLKAERRVRFPYALPTTIPSNKINGFVQFEFLQKPKVRIKVRISTLHSHSVWSQKPQIFQGEGAPWQVSFRVGIAASISCDVAVPVDGEEHFTGLLLPLLRAFVAASDPLDRRLWERGVCQTVPSWHFNRCCVHVVPQSCLTVEIISMKSESVMIFTLAPFSRRFFASRIFLYSLSPSANLSSSQS